MHRGAGIVRGHQGERAVPSGDDPCGACGDDDSGGGTDPEVSFYRPQSGVYDVWVGAYDGDGGDAELFITELN